MSEKFLTFETILGMQNVERFFKNFQGVMKVKKFLDILTKGLVGVRVRDDFFWARAGFRVSYESQEIS